MKVIVVTSDREACGIREYSSMMKEAVEAADPSIQVEEFPFTAPDRLLDRVCSPASRPEIVHLNHHAALHSGWTKDHIWALQKLGMKVVVTQHDTFETWEIMRARGFFDARSADLLIIHEPVAGLDDEKRVWVMRQPIPEAPREVKSGEAYRRRLKGIQWGRYVGSIGFPLPWKGFATLAQAARLAGWGCRIIAPGITVGQAEELQAFHPEGLEIMASFWPRGKAIAALATCDALAFPYVTGNSGTSGALRLGVAARRPVVTSPKSLNRQTLDIPEEHYIARVEPTPEALAEWLLKADLDAWALKAATLAEIDGWQARAWELSSRYMEIARGVGA